MTKEEHVVIYLKSNVIHHIQYPDDMSYEELKSRVKYRSKDYASVGQLLADGWDPLAISVENPFEGFQLFKKKVAYSPIDEPSWE